MNPITHALTGWVLGQSTVREKRDVGLITAGTVLPDLDGLGIIAERVTANSATPLLWYTEYHHQLCHNLFAGLAAAVAAGLIARDRMRTALAAFLGFHLHLLEDVLGSGGPGGERWTIPYLWPLKPDFIIDWAGQWPIEAWQNLVLSFLLMLVTLGLARSRGYSPLGLISIRADAALVETLRTRFPLPSPTLPSKKSDHV